VAVELAPAAPLHRRSELIERHPRARRDVGGSAGCSLRHFDVAGHGSPRVGVQARRSGVLGLLAGSLDELAEAADTAVLHFVLVEEREVLLVELLKEVVPGDLLERAAFG